MTNCDRYYKVRWIYYKLRQYTRFVTENYDLTASVAGMLQDLKWDTVIWNNEKTHKAVRYL